MRENAVPATLESRSDAVPTGDWSHQTLVRRRLLHHERSAHVERLTKHMTRAAVAPPGQGVVSTSSDTRQLALMIVGSYREMPGLKLTLAQAARLFGADPGACRQALDGLIQSGHLTRGPQGDYLRAR